MHRRKGSNRSGDEKNSHRLRGRLLRIQWTCRRLSAKRLPLVYTASKRPEDKANRFSFHSTFAEASQATWSDFTAKPFKPSTGHKPLLQSVLHVYAAPSFVRWSSGACHEFDSWSLQPAACRCKPLQRLVVFSANALRCDLERWQAVVAYFLAFIWIALFHRRQSRKKLFALQAKHTPLRLRALGSVCTGVL